MSNDGRSQRRDSLLAAQRPSIPDSSSSDHAPANPRAHRARDSSGAVRSDASGGPASALDAFVSRDDYALCVVTVASSSERSGCLVGFTTQCSIEPPRLVVCISKVNHTFRVAGRSRGLAVHLLGKEQADSARRFGEETGDRTDKFVGCTWRLEATGAPVLDDCAAWVDCSIERRIDLGDHVAYVVAPVRGGAGPRSGLLTYQNGPELEPGHPVG